MVTLDALAEPGLVESPKAKVPTLIPTKLTAAPELDGVDSLGPLLDWYYRINPSQIPDEGFSLFGGFSATEEVERYEDDTAMVSYSDGAVYDPTADTWRLIPPTWAAWQHTFGENPRRFRFASVPVPGGLFVWGMAPDQCNAVSALFSLDEWTWKKLDASEGPDEYYRDLWRYSLTDLEWEKNHGAGVRGCASDGGRLDIQRTSLHRLSLCHSRAL